MHIDTATIVSYALGAAVVLLFGVNQFGQGEYTVASHAAEKISIPREMTSDKAFLAASFIYIGGLLALFVAISLYGSQLFFFYKDVGNAGGVGMPFFAAMCITGLVTNIPPLSRIEQSWRAFMYRRAAIPEAVDRLIHKMRSSKLSNDALRDHINAYALASEIWAKMPSDALGDNLDKWLRAGALLSTLDKIRRSPELNEKLYTRYIDRHQDALTLVKTNYRLINCDLNGIQKSKSLDEINSRIGNEVAKIENLLQSIYIFLGCIVVRRSEAISQDEALKLCSFLQAGLDEESSPVRDKELDALVYAAGLSAASLAVVVGAAPLCSLIPDLQKYLPGWPDLRNYSANLFSWLFVQFGAFLVVVFYAWHVRNKKLNDHSWRIDTAGINSSNAMQYVKLGVRVLFWCAVTIFVLRVLEFLLNRNLDVGYGCTGSSCSNLLDITYKFFQYHWFRSIVMALFAVALIYNLDKIYRTEVLPGRTKVIQVVLVVFVLGLLANLVSYDYLKQHGGEIALFSISWAVLLVVFTSGLQRQFKNEILSDGRSRIAVARAHPSAT